MIGIGGREPVAGLDGDVLAVLEGVPPDLHGVATDMFRTFCDRHGDADLSAMEIAQAIASTVFRPVLEQERRLSGLHVAEAVTPNLSPSSRT